MDSTHTVRSILLWASEYLKTANITSFRLDAEVLLAHVLGCNRATLYMSFENKLNQTHEKKYRRLVYRRAKKEPVAYIIGRKEFMSLEFFVNKHVFIPRPETELLVETVIDFSKKMKNTIFILDLGTGSGNIAISCAYYIPNCRVIAIDIKPEIIKIAKMNARKHKVAKKIKFLVGNLFSPLALSKYKNKFDFILSNPPYISHSEFYRLAPEIKKFEPKIATYGGKDGLKIIKRIIEKGPQFLKSGGKLILEIGANQTEKIKELILANPAYKFSSFCVQKDLNGLDRIIIVERA